MNWDDYEYGRSPRQGSIGSLGSHVQFEAPYTPPTSDCHHVPRPNGGDGDGEANEVLRHRRFVLHSLSPLPSSKVIRFPFSQQDAGGAEQRARNRSSLSIRINSIAQAGGPNSLENFARSWSRAAGYVFLERTPSFVISDQGDDTLGARRSGDTPSPIERRSLLRQQLEREGTSPESAIDDESDTRQQDEEAAPQGEAVHSTSEGGTTILEHAPYLASPFASNYGGIYGSLSSRVNEPSMRRAGELYREQRMKGRQDPDKEQQPLLTKVIEQKDGKRIQIVIGQSTLPQTVFNSINVLIGVGLLSLPLGVKLSGWLIGMVFLFLAAVVTRYTAGLLTKCLDLDPALVTFSDIAWKAFGPKARLATGLLFTAELIAACVALVVLFADSLDALVPGRGIVEWKIICGLILIPLSFVPLRYLSFTSVLGILSCLGIVILIFVDGIIKPDSPGSLRQPAIAPLFPDRWSSLPLSFGLLMSPWGGHSVFPNIYRDMRHPKKYTRAINYTYIFTYALDVSVAVAGFLMFGQGVLDEITSNILETNGYPEAISLCIFVFIAIIPLTKIPLK